MPSAGLFYGRKCEKIPVMAKLNLATRPLRQGGAEARLVA